MHKIKVWEPKKPQYYMKHKIIGNEEKFIRLGQFPSHISFLKCIFNLPLWSLASKRIVSIKSIVCK